MDDLVAFCRARLDEIDPDDYHDRTECHLGKLQTFGDCSCRVPEMVRRDIAAKRRILDEYEEASAYYGKNRAAPAGELHGLLTAVKLLALPHADHHDYQERWKL